MNFTREPIIETIITPKEGCRLVIRNSKVTGQEEYTVEAVEVVSFGKSFFFRSLDQSKSFLLPVSDYEVLEEKESRMVLKQHLTHEKSIKIGGGKEGGFKLGKQQRHHQEKAVEPAHTAEVTEPSEQPVVHSQPQHPQQQQKSDNKKRDRRRHRRRRMPEERMDMAPQNEPAPEGAAPTAPPTFSKLFPPPPTLISEKLNKLKKETSEKPGEDFPENLGPSSSEMENRITENFPTDTQMNSTKSSWLGFFTDPFKN